MAEDHYPAGGLGSAVLDALNEAGRPAEVTHLCVRDLPSSGTPAELMDAAGIWRRPTSPRPPARRSGPPGTDP